MRWRCWGVFLVCILFARLSWAAEDRPPDVIFQDDFEQELHESWRWLREDRSAWRIRDGALEIRAQPGDAGTVRNALLRDVPDRGRHEYAIEVTVTNAAPPTEQYEQLGLTWYHDGKPVFKFVKERIDGETFVFPGRVPMKEDSVKLRLVVRGRKVTAQYCAADEDEYQTAIEAELPPPGEQDEISLQTYHGPADAEHWMRFDDFRIVKDEG
jgi:hypothetical protein